MVADIKTVHETEEVEPQPEILYWNEDYQAKDNYRNLGERLAKTGDLFRHADHTIGLLRVLDDGEYREIATAKTLGPVIVDRIPVQVVKDGKRPTLSERPLHRLGVLGEVCHRPPPVPVFDRDGRAGSPPQ